MVLGGRGSCVEGHTQTAESLLDGRLGALSDSTRIPVAEPALETERLLLRRLAPGAAAALHRCTGDPAVMRYWHPGPDPDVAATQRRIAEIEAHWREHGFGDFAVVARDSGELIGFAGLHRIADITEVNVGYALASTRWRCGLGTDLCQALLAHGFTVLALPKVVAVIDPRNTVSVALAERCGLLFRRELTWQGQPRVLHALTQTEFEAGR